MIKLYILQRIYADVCQQFLSIRNVHDNMAHLAMIGDPKRGQRPSHVTITKRAFACAIQIHTITR